MKTIFCIVMLTIVYVVSMTKFTDYQNYVNASLMADLENQFNGSFEFNNNYFGSGNFDIDDEYILTVSFLGQVSSKKEIQVYYGSTFEQALQLAGGLLSNADTRAINLSYIIEEDATFYIPSMSRENKVSINKGSLEELDSLPSIGQITSNKIIDYRSINGPFKCIEEIKKVAGIGSGTFDKIKDYIILWKNIY